MQITLWLNLYHEYYSTGNTNWNCFKYYMLDLATKPAAPPLPGASKHIYTTRDIHYKYKCEIQILEIIFSSPEPKAGVSYGHSAPSVVRPSSSSVNFSHFRLLLQNRLVWFWWNFVGMKYSWPLTSVVVFWPDPPRGGSRDGKKIGHGGPLLQETSSSDRMTTATNRMHSNDLVACGKKCFYF